MFKLRKKSVYFLMAGLVFSLMLTTPVKAAKKAANRENFYKEIELFSDALATVQQDYVEKLSSKDIIYGALRGMLGSLDPYSQFMEPDDYKELQIETEGQFGGLGIEITIRDHLLTIITPLDDTPAEKAGLKAMDRIVKINDEITKDMTLTDAVKKMRGKPGTKVTLTVMRGNEDTLKTFTITREIIQVKAVRKAIMLDKSVGYIKLTDFSEKTKKDLSDALAKLEKQGMNSLILDLRNNPGGLLVSAVQAASEFIPSGQMVVYTKGRAKHQDVEYRAEGKTDFKHIPMIVMINGGSASASEILAGAIQDHKRGIILGTTSFGKGLVQTVIPLRDGSALRLTTARYYTPAGRMINEKGITPDVVVKPEPPEKEKPVDKEVLKEEQIFQKLENKKALQLPEKKSEEKKPEAKKEDKQQKKRDEMLRDDNQLRAALNLMHGIEIYRGMNSKLN